MNQSVVLDVAPLCDSSNFHIIGLSCNQNTMQTIFPLFTLWQIVSYIAVIGHCLYRYVNPWAWSHFPSGNILSANTWELNTLGLKTWGLTGYCRVAGVYIARITNNNHIKVLRIADFVKGGESNETLLRSFRTSCCPRCGQYFQREVPLHTSI